MTPDNFKCIALVPVFNRKDKLDKFFHEALKVKDFFWLIVDDNSTDGTKDKVEQYQQKSNAIGYINTNDGNLFWGGTLNFALKNMEYIKKKYNLNHLLYYVFINDDIQFNANEINKAFPTFDGKSIYSAIAYRRNKYIVGFKIDNNIRILKMDTLPTQDVEVDTVAGYMQFYPINYIDSISEFLPHYHADVSYCYSIANKYKCKVYATPKIIVNIDDSDKAFMAKMTLKDYLYNIKSPYEYKANIYYFLQISKDLKMFLKLMINYFYRLIRSKIYYKLKFWRYK